MTVLEQALRLPQSEKIDLMEALWTDLSSQEGSKFESPEWHGTELAETSQRIALGTEKFLPWQEARHLLRNRKADGD